MYNAVVHVWKNQVLVWNACFFEFFFLRFAFLLADNCNYKYKVRALAKEMALCYSNHDINDSTSYVNLLIYSSLEPNGHLRYTQIKYCKQTPGNENWDIHTKKKVLIRVYIPVELGNCTGLVFNFLGKKLLSLTQSKTHDKLNGNF